MAGRGFGKTRLEMEDAFWFGATNANSRIGLIAPTYADARDTMVEGSSGLLEIIPRPCLEQWNRSLGELILWNGTRYKLFAATEPERLRGPQHHRIYCDELAAWEYPETWDQALFGLRLGERPRAIIATTPKNTHLLKDLIANPRTHLTRGSTFENSDNLARSALEELREKYEGTSLGRQELYAEIVEDLGSGYFKPEYFIPIDALPPRESLRVYGGSDYAVTSNGGDYTVHAVLGIDPDGNPWLLDLWRKQASSDEWVASFCDLVRKWRPMAWAEEQGQIKSGVGPFLEREMRSRQAYVAREQFPTKGDKAVRAQSFRGMIATRGLRVPARAEWRPAFIEELIHFPGVHDDQVDACGLVGQLLDKMLLGTKPKTPQQDNLSAYSDTRQRRYDEALDVLTI